MMESEILMISRMLGFSHMHEYIGTRIDIDQSNETLKITQPVLVQSLMDESTFSEPNAWPETPAMAGMHLMASGIKLCVAAQTRCCSGVGKLLYLVKWSHREIVNSVRELTWFMTKVFPNCVNHATCNMCCPCLNGDWSCSQMVTGMAAKNMSLKSMEFLIWEM